MHTEIGFAVVGAKILSHIDLWPVAAPKQMVLVQWSGLFRRRYIAAQTKSNFTKLSADNWFLSRSYLLRYWIFSYLFGHCDQTTSPSQNQIFSYTFSLLVQMDIHSRRTLQCIHVNRQDDTHKPMYNSADWRSVNDMGVDNCVFVWLVFYERPMQHRSFAAYARDVIQWNPITLVKCRHMEHSTDVRHDSGIELLVISYL